MQTLLLLVLATLAVAFAATPLRIDPHRIQNEHAQYLKNSYRAVLDIQREVAGKGHAVSLQTTAQDCYNALWFAGVIIQNCSLDDTFWEEKNLTLIQQQIDGYCSAKDTDGHTCVEKVVASVANFATQCWAASILNATQVDGLKQLLTFSYLPCIQDDTGKWCYVEFQKTSMLWDSQANIDNALLTQTCTNCTFAFLNILAAYANPAFYYVLANYYVACTRNDADTAFCFPTYYNAVNSFGPGAPTQQQNANLCDACTQKIVWRQWYLSVTFPGLYNATTVIELGQFLGASEYLCQKNFDGQYCAPLVEAYDFSSLNASCTPSSFVNCVGTACQTALQQFTSTLGCCSGTWFDILEFQFKYDNAHYDMSVPPTVLENAIENTCKVPIPAGCAKQEIAAVLYIANVNHTWYLEHKTEVDKLISDTILYVAAVDVVKLTTLAVQQWNGAVPSNAVVSAPSSAGYKLLASSDPLPGIQVSYTLSDLADDQATSVHSTLNSAQLSNANNPAATFSTGLDFNAVIDPTVPVSFASSATLQNPNTPANAASLSAPISLASVALLMFVALGLF